MEKQCQNCHHFCRAQTETMEEADYGECWRYPPKVIVSDGEIGYECPQVAAERPECGEWKANQ